MTPPSAQLPATWASPGLVDLQVNGYAGVDFLCDPATWTADQWHTARQAMARRGVVHVAVTFITDAPDALVARAGRYRELIEADAVLAAFFPCLHIEGPFISGETGPRGAHPQEHCTTPARVPDLLDRLQDASGGRLGIVTVAPELDGAIELIETWSARGVCMSLGHTAASEADIDRAIAAGAKLCTHLGNGSHQTMPRLANYVQYQLAQDALTAGFIADGHHIPFPTLKNFLRAKTHGRSVLVTDAVLAAEMPPGRYTCGGAEIELSPAGRVQVPGQPNLAGSALTLDRAVLHVATYCDVDFATAWAMASTQPAALLGLPTPEEVTVEVTDEGFRLQQTPGP